ncbi:MAG: SIR2 family protein [Oscillospiraceae bacterium]|nr:SIR2 family protein [Oscillospiraceae bacterium]
MKIVKFSDVKNEIIQNFRRKSLIPCIGSGFSHQCKAHNGKVPSGRTYKEYMIEQLFALKIIPEIEKDSIAKESFSEVSDIYHKSVPLSFQKKYLTDNFTQVQLPKVKMLFLSLPWPYIYSLNIDDAVENNAPYNVVYSNRPVDDSIFETCQCVIKLHGDVSEIVSYTDSISEIFTKRQYIESISSNHQLLNRLYHDSEINNLIFIGCSLDDEIDLSIYLKSSEEYSNSRYFITCEKPSFVQQNKLENYGITHCVLFDDYEDIYQKLYEAGQEAQKLVADQINDISSLKQTKLQFDFNDNKPFLFHGKGLIDKSKNKFIIPCFLIQRNCMKSVLKGINKFPFQIIAGRSFSGKTYAISDLALRIKDKTVFYFSSKERLTMDAFMSLIETQESVLIFDSNALSRQQYDYIFNHLDYLKNNGIRFIAASHIKDNDVFDIRRLFIIQGKIKESDVPIINIPNCFDEIELKTINPSLASINAGIFTSDTIVDNVISMAKKNEESYKFQNTTPLFTDYKYVATLIILATKRKAYSRDASMFHLLSEFEEQCKYAAPLIESEETYDYEINARDNSPKKYVTYANQWLLMQLSTFAEKEDNHETIIQAYRYIVDQIIVYYGGIDVQNSKKVSAYKDYILFDNINSLFCSGKNAHYGLELIRKIYDSLNDRLSLDPNYMHQRAKCYIKTSKYEHLISNKLDCLTQASRYANVAKQIFEDRYEKSLNEKIQISIAHLTYTQALIMCHKCNINNFMDKDENTNALIWLYDALSSPYNSYEYALKDSFNYDNVINQMILKITQDKTAFHETCYSIMGPLIKATTKF